MEGIAKITYGFGLLFFLMLKSRVLYMLLHLRNLSGGVISIITVLNFLWVWLENLAGNTFLKDKSR